MGNETKLRTIYSFKVKCCRDAWAALEMGNCISRVWCDHPRSDLNSKKFRTISALKDFILN